MPVDLHCAYNSSVSTLYIMHVQFHCVYDLMDLCDYVYGFLCDYALHVQHHAVQWSGETYLTLFIPREKLVFQTHLMISRLFRLLASYLRDVVSVLAVTLNPSPVQTWRPACFVCERRLCPQCRQSASLGYGRRGGAAIINTGTRPTYCWIRALFQLICNEPIAQSSARGKGQELMRW